LGHTAAGPALASVGPSAKPRRGALWEQWCYDVINSSTTFSMKIFQNNYMNIKKTAVHWSWSVWTGSFNLKGRGQNHLQKVLDSWALHLCRGTWNFKIWRNTLLAYSVSYFTLGAWSFLWGARTTKGPPWRRFGRGHSSCVPTFMFMTNSILLLWTLDSTAPTRKGSCPVEIWAASASAKLLTELTGELNFQYNYFTVVETHFRSKDNRLGENN